MDGLVVGPYCDVYPSPEAELGVTRAALEVLCERDIGFALITKGTTVVRDADLLRHPGTLVQMSLCSLDAEALARHEPGAASPDERLMALDQLASLGVEVLVQATPWVPGLTDLRALRARVDPAIPIRTTPLRLPPPLDARSPLVARGPDRGQPGVPGRIPPPARPGGRLLVAPAAARRVAAAPPGQPGPAPAGHRRARAHRSGPRSPTPRSTTPQVVGALASSNILSVAATS